MNRLRKIYFGQLNKMDELNWKITKYYESIRDLNPRQKNQSIRLAYNYGNMVHFIG